MKKIFLANFFALLGVFAFAQNEGQDTLKMKVDGNSAQFSFVATKPAAYCVDWGDGIQERRNYYKAGTTKQWVHTYDSLGTYSIIFFCEKSDWIYDGCDYTETIPDINFAMDMIAVDSGTFTMGCGSEQALSCSHSGETIQTVTLTSYYIGKYEVTQAQWMAVMGPKSNPSYYKGDDNPVDRTSWYDAKRFCDSLSKKTGRKYALPTEAQWEFAARGGVKSKGYKYSGSNNVDEVAWHIRNSASSGHRPTTYSVGMRVPNELGIYDMSGNIDEWCADWYGDYSSDAVTNPTGPDFGYAHVVRGGSVDGYIFYCSVSDRSKAEYPSFRIIDPGFRVVCLP